MAKLRGKKPERPRGDVPTPETVVALKDAAAWTSRLDGFSGHCRLRLADTIEQSLLCYARERGCRTRPKRWA